MHLYINVTVYKKNIHMCMYTFIVKLIIINDSKYHNSTAHA